MEIGYPPEAVEDAESRRVMNNLKNWDAKERHKRKLTRDATLNQSTKQSQSVAENVSNRASAIWKNIGGRSRPKRPSGTDHQVLQDAELEGDQDEDGDVRLSIFVSSPLGSPAEPSTPMQSNYTRKSESGDPFKDPKANSTIKRESREDGSTAEDFPIMDPLSTPKASDLTTPAPQVSESVNTYARQRIPPQPLHLPPPKTPPPPPVSPQPSEAASPKQSFDDEPGRGRWWTEWLCGCSEGTDRGGDKQAGKTNPFE